MSLDFSFVHRIDDFPNVRFDTSNRDFFQFQFSFSESYDMQYELLKSSVSGNSEELILGLADCLINIASIDIEFGYLT